MQAYLSRRHEMRWLLRADTTLVQGLAAIHAVMHPDHDRL